MARQRLYGVFWHDKDNRLMWAMTRNGRNARRNGRMLHALVLSMILPSSNGAWDAPTFRMCADRIEGDWR